MGNVPPLPPGHRHRGQVTAGSVLATWRPPPPPHTCATASHGQGHQGTRSLWGQDGAMRLPCGDSTGTRVSPVVTG